MKLSSFVYKARAIHYVGKLSVIQLEILIQVAKEELIFKRIKERKQQEKLLKKYGKDNNRK